MSRRITAMLLGLALLMALLPGCSQGPNADPPPGPAAPGTEQATAGGEGQPGPAGETNSAQGAAGQTPPSPPEGGGTGEPTSPQGSEGESATTETSGEDDDSLTLEERERLYEETRALGLGWLTGQPAVAHPKPDPYQPPAVAPAVPAYQVAGDLSNVANRSQFGPLTPEQQRLLAQNGFFAAPTDFIQPFFLYENNTYWDIPSFITTDSVLHTYHLFFDYAMRGVEYSHLLPDLTRLTEGMLARAVAAHRETATPNLQEAALGAVVYFGVPARLLGLEAEVPPAAEPLIAQELRRIAAHGGRAELTFLPFEMDYSMFVPRGHYTRAWRLEQYFRAMMWYGLVPFPLGEEGREPTPAELRATRMALLMATLMGPEEEQLWRNIYEPTALFVGLADDATPLQYWELYRGQAGDGGVEALESDAAVRAFIQKALAELPPPGISQQLAGIPGGRQMRFMGQRFVLDSAVLQALVKWPERPIPTGLDVAAAFGSPRAREILLDERREGENWAEYPTRLAQQTERVAELSDEEWQSNLYQGWLWTWQPLLTPRPEGYPWFMRTPAWQDKSLNTMLGSWTQLRHDTILYAKPSGAQCGGDSEIPPPPPGYVEPEPEFYGRLEWLIRNTLAELTARGLLDEAMVYPYREFADLLQDLKEISIKELSGQELSREEQDRIRFYGAALEGLSIRTVGGYKGWYELTSEVDREMAVVADVHTSGTTVLEEAVGRPHAIFVAFPAGGRVWLGRGAIYSHYEFLHPAADRLTDEAWLRRVQAHETPAPPAWTRSFLTGEKAQVLEPETKVIVPCGGNGSGGQNPG